MTGSPRIDAWTATGPTDPSVRTRVVAWAALTGVDLRLHAASGPAALGSRVAARRSGPAAARGVGVSLVLRNAAKLSRGGLEERLLRRAGTGIYELDDGLPWDDGRLPGLGAWWKVPFRRDRLADRAARAADRVIAGNDLLAEWAAARCRDVRVIPTCVDPDDYDAKSDYEVADPPRVLWIGSAATAPELARIAPVLGELHRRTGAVVEVLGAPGTLPPALAPFATLVPWSLDAQRHAPARADVGVMPLADGVYQRAKCGYKLLQYAAAGLPSVASPVGVNAGMLASGLGAAAVTEADWLDQLQTVLAAGPEVRRAMGDSARTAVDAWTYRAWEPAWRDAVGA